MLLGHLDGQNSVPDLNGKGLLLPRAGNKETGEGKQYKEGLKRFFSLRDCNWTVVKQQSLGSLEFSMISSPRTIVWLFCQWLERMSPCQQQMLIKTASMPESCSSLLTIIAVTNSEGHPGYQITLKIPGQEWRNRNSIFWVSPCPVCNLPGSLPALTASRWHYHSAFIRAPMISD